MAYAFVKYIIAARTVEIFPDAVEKRDESMGDWQ